MHSFLQRKLKNLHGEARVWGSSTPRPPPLIVQPHGGLSSAAGSRVHGARVPGGRGAGRGAERGGRRERGGSAAPLGAAPGEPAARPHPSKLERDSLGLPEGSGRAAGGRVSGRTTRGTSPWVGAPFQGPAPGGTRTGSRAGPGPLGLAVSPRRPPAQCPHRAGLRGAEKGSAGPEELARKAALPRAARLPRATRAWESGGREAPAGRAGPWRLRSVRSDSREPAGGRGEGGGDVE